MKNQFCLKQLCSELLLVSRLLYKVVRATRHVTGATAAESPIASARDAACDVGAAAPVPKDFFFNLEAG